MRIFNDPWRARDEITYYRSELNTFTPEERKNWRIALFNSDEYAYEFIEKKLYQDDEELIEALTICLHNHTQAAKIYFHFNNLLTDTQKTDILKMSFEKWESILIIFSKLDNSKRKEAIDRLIMAPSKIERLISLHDLSEEEIDYILPNYEDRTEVLKAILKKQKHLVKGRKNALRGLINSRETIYSVAKNDYLNKKELQTVHDIYWGDYFKQYKCSYKTLIEYATTFAKVLNEFEWGCVTKRLMGLKRHDDIESFVNVEGIPEDYKFILDGFLVAERLRGKH